MAAMSMKSLLHSDDESDETLPPIIPTAHPPSVTVSGARGSALKSMFSKGTKRLSSHFQEGQKKHLVVNSSNAGASSINDSEAPTATASTSSAGWIKDKVTGSLMNRLATNKNVYASMDTVHPDASTNDDAPKLSKAQSEMTLKSSLSTGNISQTDGGGSKRQWLKGQITSYLSKSKTTENLSSAPSDHPTQVNGSHGDPVITPPGSSMNTVTTDETHLPILKPKPSSTPPKASPEKHGVLTTSSGSPKNDQSPPPPTTIDKKHHHHLHITKPESISRIMNNVSLSDLIHSQRSPTSPGELKSPTLLSPTHKDQGDTISANDTSITDDNQATIDQEMDILVEEIVREDLKHHIKKPNESFPITFTQLWYMSLLMFGYLQHNLPSYFEGCVTGCLLTYLIGCGIIWAISSSADSTLEYKKDLKSLLKREKEQQTFEVFKGLPKPDALQKPRTLKVWMSLAHEYDGEFDKEKTKEIYTVVHQQTVHLFVCKPRPEEKKTQRPKASKIKKQLQRETRKAAIERAEREKALFSFEWHYMIRLNRCLLYLKPDDLPIRRIWNKKYPMKLCIPQTALVKKQINSTLEEISLQMDDILQNDFAVDSDSDTDDEECVKSGTEDEGIYLFSTTGREKEDLFYRMQLCIKALKHQVTFDELKENLVSKSPAQSYPHYMIDLITESERVMQRNIKGKKMEPHLAWLNIFIGRAFWDFWHESYWIDKLHQKIQTRLTKLNTPPFITSIKLKELNSGHNVPIIHKGSVPTLDEYGVWTDLQITYKGYFTLTLETQLNVDYYVGLVSSIVKQKAGTDPKYHAQLSKLTKLSELQHDEEDHQTLPDERGNQNALHDQSILDDSLEEEAVLMHDVLHEAYLNDMDSQDGTDEPDETDGLDPFMSDPRTKAFLESNAGKKVVNLVGWLAKSKIAKKVAETEFAKKAYERAYEKFRKMPIILRVDIQNVKGNLAINLPPPPSNRLWFGFRNQPVIFISATPKVGEKQVRLTYLTNWIERKLKEEFKKYLVLPSMQDISIKLMDSQLKDLCPERPMS
ncbi:testis-expressed protein 2-like [Clytia hemisphaerica]|uniref:SMP-LTD domain-containing protein n=1 Tax=Clytia hemisphaerica TaxID=252671 RepID=A0A7M5VBJ5_9CNID